MPSHDRESLARDDLKAAIAWRGVRDERARLDQYDLDRIGAARARFAEPCSIAPGAPP